MIHKANIELMFVHVAPIGSTASEIDLSCIHCLSPPTMLRGIVLLTLLAAGCLASDPNFGGHAEVHDEAHIKQHMENKVDVDKMTEDQQRFYYFSMHDLNKDQVIDGIEILKALTHDHDDEHGPGIKVEDEEKLIQMIDSVLADLDANGDGMVDYAEYSRKHKQP